MLRTYDAATVDSAGAFLVGELERLDQELHAPLVSVTWHRDIGLREDVTISDESSAFLTTNFAAPGGVNPRGKNWIGQVGSAVPGISADTGKKTSPMHLWGMVLGYSIIELAAAQQLGRPIDSTLYDAMRVKHNMDVDEQVYVGDAEIGCSGLLNNPNVAPTSIAGGWSTATPKAILEDINELLNDVWQQSGYAVCPRKLGLPPSAFTHLVQPVSDAASKSILTYVIENAISTNQNGRPLEIVPMKWAAGRGVAGADRMVAYTQENIYVRFPLVPLQRTPVEFRGINQLTTYFGKLGEVEFVYPETIGYADGL